MLAVNMMRICGTAPEPLKQETQADDDGDADATADVLYLIRATPRAPGQESTPVPVDHDAMATQTPTERRNTALRVGYAACLLPG